MHGLTSPHLPNRMAPRTGEAANAFELIRDGKIHWTTNMTLGARNYLVAVPRDVPARSEMMVLKPCWT